MAIIVENARKNDECMIPFPVGHVEKVQIKVGKYRWNVDLENGTVDLMDLLLGVDRQDAKEIRRALVMFEDYLHEKKENKDNDD